MYFTAALLETSSAAVAAQVSGLSPQHTASRIAAHLFEWGQFGEAPHPRESPKFTPEVLQAARERMLAGGDTRYTTSELIAYLVKGGLLESPVNHSNFLKRFKEHLGTLGETLVVGSRSMVFLITAAAARKREATARQLLHELATDYGLGSIIFEDETTFEEGPHPKGKGDFCKPGMQQAAFSTIARPALQPLKLMLAAHMYHCMLIAMMCWKAPRQATAVAKTEKCAAGQKVHNPYLYIKERQAPMQKQSSSKGKAMAGRRKLMLMVFIRLGYPPVVITCTGSSYPGMPKLKQYKRPKSTEKYSDLSSFEYKAGIKKALTQLTSKEERSDPLSKAGPVVLLQDNDKAHIANRVKAYAAKSKAPRLLLRFLPSHSPDLTPHDSGFLAEVKRSWHLEKDSGLLSWPSLCQRAIQLTQEADPENYIRGVPSRWRACVAAHGWHIEEQLLQMKKK